MRASLKGAMRAGIRAASRTSAKNLTNQPQQESEEIDGLFMTNLKSLAFASSLLYLSWIIVIGLGQPFADLLESTEAKRQAVIEKRLEEENFKEFQDLAIYAFEKEEQLKIEKQEYDELRNKLKKRARHKNKWKSKRKVQVQHETVAFATNELKNALRFQWNPNGIPMRLKKRSRRRSFLKHWTGCMHMLHFRNTSWSSMVILVGWDCNVFTHCGSYSSYKVLGQNEKENNLYLKRVPLEE